MKTLEYLKIKIFNNVENDFETKYGLFSNGYDNGYFQCKEDMADTIKQAIEYGYQLRNNHKPINSGIDWVEEFNSLNKQD